MTFGETIAARRRQLGIPQKALANALNISPGMLSKIENGTRKPSKKLSNNIVKTLRMDDAPDVNYLTGNTTVDLPIALESNADKLFYISIPVWIVYHFHISVDKKIVVVPGFVTEFAHQTFKCSAHWFLLSVRVQY